MASTKTDENATHEGPGAMAAKITGRDGEGTPDGAYAMDVNSAYPAEVKDLNWNSVKWQTAVQETGTQIVFDTIGDTFIGMFTGKRHAVNDGEDFTILTFTGTDGEAYQTNAGWKLSEGFSDIPSGTIVRIKYVKDVETGSPSPMKDFRVDVASV
jgi:hypothetical protein